MAGHGRMVIHGFQGCVGKGLTGASLCPPREEGKLRGPCSIAQQSLVFSVGSAASRLLQTGPDGPRSGCSSVAAAGLGDNAGEQFQVPHLPFSTQPFG